jgi:hypothetical protein
VHKRNRLKENLAYRQSRNTKAEQGSSSDISEDEDSEYGAEYDYNSMSDCLVQFIMVEYSNGTFNKNWLKFFFKNEHFRATVRQRLLNKQAQ